MNSSDKVSPKTSLPLTDLIVPEFLLGLATAPLLVGLVGTKVVTQALRELGELSEEVFRGDRLPTLNFPSPADPHGDKSASP
ncbi:hypothetical protein K9N68_22310 [Kovacikia minuta CCNUW1]|uniref:hypothetical protein n=1 Tax=Kovacikia minuta TaxID=2931930 RepID=UPI001CC97B92|nr:hypothetical protein [Kovacikia minuta]UBF24416.1 hypothetical protein K9N68_22310 [Kovacikia minuta CCNUW1]